MSNAPTLDPDLDRSLLVLKNRAENLARTFTQIGMTNPSQWRDTLSTFTAATAQLRAICDELLRMPEDGEIPGQIYDNLALYPHAIDEYFAHIPDQLRSRLDPTMENEDRMLVDSMESDGFSANDKEGLADLRTQIKTFNAVVNSILESPQPQTADELGQDRPPINLDPRVGLEDGPEPLRALQNAIYRGEGLIPAARVTSRGPTPAPISRQPTPNPAQYGSGPMASGAAGVAPTATTATAAVAPAPQALPHVAVSSAPSRTAIQQQQLQAQQQQAILAQQQLQAQQQQQIQQQQQQQIQQQQQYQQSVQAQQVAQQQQQQAQKRHQMLLQQQQQQQIQAQQQQMAQQQQLQQPPGMSLLQQQPSRTAQIGSVRFSAPQQQQQLQHQQQQQMAPQQTPQQQQLLRMKMQQQQQLQQQPLSQQQQQMYQQQQLQQHQLLQQQQQRAAGAPPKIPMAMPRPNYPPQPK